MIARLHSIEDIDWPRFCEQSIPAMDVSRVGWPDGVESWAQKEALLAERLVALIEDRKSLAFVARTAGEVDLMIGAGLFERRSFRLLLTFYTPEGAAVALTDGFVREWIDWLMGKGATEIVAPVPEFRREAIGRLFDLSDDDFTTDSSGQTVARLWHAGANE